MKPRIPKNLLPSIEARRYGVYSRSMKSTYRYNNRIMRNLVESPDWLFKRVMKVRSNNGVAFDRPDKLYTENQRNCSALRGACGNPTLMYSIDTGTHPGRWRYETSLTILRAGMSNPDPPRCDLRLLLTSSSFLEVREESTGKLIDIINLGSRRSPGVKFLAMHHDSSLDQVIVSSTKPARSDIVRHIVVLGLCPIVRKTLRMAIHKEVFGQNVTDVDLFDGILRVLHKREVVKMYDFNEICRNNQIDSRDGDQVLLIKNIGTPLYVVEGSNLMIEIDGFPYHYIACSQNRNEYTVRTMDHREVATFPIDENDKLAFQPDVSGIIAHTDKASVTLFKFVTDENTGKSCLEKLRAIKIMDTNRDISQLHEYAVPQRRSQRTTRRPPRQLPEVDDDERIVFSDDFEDELYINLLIGNDNEDPHRRGVVQLFDTDTGAHIKTIKFSKKLPMNTEYLVTLDLDVLVVISAGEGGTAGEAHVYRLLHREAWGDECLIQLYEPPGARNRTLLDPDSDFVPRRSGLNGAP